MKRLILAVALFSSLAFADNDKKGEEKGKKEAGCCCCCACR